MQIKSESIEVGGVKYTTTQFPAMRSFELLAKLTKTIGPAFGAMVSLDQSMDVVKAAPVLMGALSNVEPSTLTKLVMEVLEATTVIAPDDKGVPAVTNMGTKSAIDRMFSGKLQHLFQVVAHAIQVNYADFFASGSDSTESAPPAASA